MPAKTKKKAVNTKSSGTPSRDSVTGLTLDGLGQIVSDKVYDKNSLLVKDLGLPADYLSTVGSLDVEVEFDNKYIVFTVKSVDGQSHIGTSRTVFQGDFQYARGRVQSARVDTMAQIGGNEAFGYGDISSLGVTIPQPSSPSSWITTLESAIYSADNRIASFDIGAVEPGVITGDYAPFAAFGGGKFFADGWRADPFAPNLL